MLFGPIPCDQHRVRGSSRSPALLLLRAGPAGSEHKPSVGQQPDPGRARGRDAGDLARKKIYPSLFALYYEGHLPEHFHIYGYARSKMSDAEFREYIGGSLTCRLAEKDKCGDKMGLFLDRCLYHAGQYAEKGDFAALAERLAGTEQARGAAGLCCLAFSVLHRVGARVAAYACYDTGGVVAP